MNAEIAIDRIRNVRRNLLTGAHPLDADAALAALEHDLAGTKTEDFNACPVEGFDTILSYLSRTNPEAFDLIDEPVHGTISDGLRIAQYARSRGLPVLRVAAPPHMKRRFPKAKTVNAYPTHLLVEVFG